MPKRLTDDERRLREWRRLMGPQSREEDASPLAEVKWEAAEALGLVDKVRRVGWGGLSAAESGRVGGYMTKLRAGRGELRQAAEARGRAGHAAPAQESRDP